MTVSLSPSVRPFVCPFVTFFSFSVFGVFSAFGMSTGVSKKFQEFIKEVSSVFQESFKGVSRVFQGSFKGVFKKF